MIQMLIEVLFNVLSSLLMIILVIAMGKPRWYGRGLVIRGGVLGLIYAFVVTVFNLNTRFEGIVGVAVYAVLVMLFSVILTKAVWWQRIFISAYWQVLLALSSIGTLTLLQYFNGDSAFEMMNSNYGGRIYVLILALGIKFLGCLFFFVLQRRQLLEVKTFDGIIFSAFSMTFTVGMLMLISFVLKQKAPTGSNYILLVLLFFVIAVCVVFLRFSVLSSEARKQEEVLVLLRNSREHSEDIESLKKSVSIIRHDMKKHIGVAEQLIAEGKYTDARAYLNELDKENATVTEQARFCANTVVDAVLKRSNTKMREKNVDFLVRIQGELDCYVKEIDLCTMLTNLLDNAEEAAEQCEGERTVIFEGRGDDQSLYICVRNTIAESVVKRNPTMQSTKNDAHLHGWGLQSVQDVVRRYDGAYRNEEEDHWFQSEIYITK